MTDLTHYKVPIPMIKLIVVIKRIVSLILLLLFASGPNSYAITPENCLDTIISNPVELKAQRATDTHPTKNRKVRHDNIIVSFARKKVLKQHTNVSQFSAHLKVKKVVNSNMQHAAERAVERCGFVTIQEARTSLKLFSKSIKKRGLPPSAIKDTAHADRVIVPGFGRNGAVVYQHKNGVLKLKTVLIWRAPP